MACTIYNLHLLIVYSRVDQFKHILDRPKKTAYDPKTMLVSMEHESIMKINKYFVCTTTIW